MHAGAGHLLATIELAVTYLGSAVVLLPAALVYRWLGDRRAGRVLLVTLGCSYAFNHLLKTTLGLPRPFDLDPGSSFAAARATALGAGWPSGHTQAAVVFWLFLAFRHRSRRLWAVALAAVGLVAGSRVALGVHFPLDVLGGLFVGVVLVWLALRLPPGWRPGWAVAAAVAGGSAGALGGATYALPLGIAAGAFAAAPDLPGWSRRRAALAVAGGLALAAAAWWVASTPALAAGALLPWGEYLLLCGGTWALADGWPRLAAWRSRVRGEPGVH